MFVFLFFDLYTHVESRWCRGPWQGFTGSDVTSGRCCQGGGVGVGGEVTGCHLRLGLVLQLPSCSLWASPSPWLVLTRCTCANLASSSTLGQRRRLSPIKRTSKHANNVKALRASWDSTYIKVSTRTVSNVLLLLERCGARVSVSFDPRLFYGMPG